MGTIVETRQGKLEGFEEAGIQVFRGIPYGKPPLGTLRFRPPEAPEPWSGLREAREFAPSAPQNAMLMAMLPGISVGPQHEDCLYLNVYAPAAGDAPRPVMVWIHGGGFVIGSGSQSIYDGVPLARRGDVVVVTINYRLGAFGFLHLEDRWAEALGASGNAGLLDQIAALEWVHDNIEAFGGDPANVTIFGESAGGMSVGTLLGTPAARGLFQRAIPQSGAAHNSHDAATAAHVGELLIRELAIDPGNPEELRALPTERILEAQNAIMLEGARKVSLLPFQPVVDGRVIPKPPLESVREGSARDVSLLVGTTRDEWNLFAFMDAGARTLSDEGLVERFAARLPGTDARALAEAYRLAREVHGPTEAGTLFLAMETDRMFRIPAVRLAEAQVPHAPAAVYKYLVTWSSPALGGGLGACHAIELPFVFGTLDKAGVEKFVGGGPQAATLSERVMDAWIAFARNGQPGHSDLPEWPHYDLERRTTMLLGADCGIEEDPAGAERRAWEGIL